MNNAQDPAQRFGICRRWPKSLVPAERWRREISQSQNRESLRGRKSVYATSRAPSGQGISERDRRQAGEARSSQPIGTTSRSIASRERSPLPWSRWSGRARQRPSSLSLHRGRWPNCERHFHSDVKACILAEINKDLTKHPIAEIEKHLTGDAVNIALPRGFDVRQELRYQIRS